jgi:pimeloyl-ACP methyl ester carboxylesterase
VDRAEISVGGAGGVELVVERLGDPTAPPVMLIAGHGAPRQWWDDELCALLVEDGFCVVRHDNRDVGASTWFEDAGTPELGALLRGGHADVPYTLWDMADDAAGVVAALGMASAHVVGVSLGGMIAQCLAISHPSAVRSLCSVMSTTGSPGVGAMAASTLDTLAALAAAYTDPIEREVATARRFASPAYAFDEPWARGRAERILAAGGPPGGPGRQLAAMLVSGDRTAALGHVLVPTLVVHGDADAIVTVDGGRATARAVPGSRLVVVRGLAHELPPGCWPTVVPAMVALARRADGS